MTEFRSAIALPHIPDDLTVPQFFLDDYKHPSGSMRRGPNDVWFIDDSTGRKFTFGELKERANCAAKGLATSRFIKNDEVVLFVSPNHVDYVIGIWACHRLGGVIAMVNPMSTTGELINVFGLCKATKIVTDERFLGTVAPAAKACGISSTSIILLDISETPSPTSKGYILLSSIISEGQSSDVKLPDHKLAPGAGKTKAAFIFFSSGTTGKSKAVELSHYAVLANVIQMTALHRDNGKPRAPEKWALLSEDVISGLLPFFHVYGLVVNVYWACFLGLIVDIIPKFSFSDLLTSITKHHISHLFLVPPIVVLLSKDPRVEGQDYSHVKHIITGGASTSVPLIHDTSKRFPNATISQGYGMTESIIVAAQSPLKHLSDGSCGPMLPGCVAKVLKSDGSYGGPDEAGELVVTSPSMGMRYIGDEEATKSTFVDGWVHSGDEVRFSEAGELFVVDRLKELIKVRGFQVAPAELEDHLIAHRYVADACVIGFPDEYSGEVPLAFIVPSDLAKQELSANETDEARIKLEIQQHVADHKVKEKWLAGGVRFIDAVPKSPSGKVLRRLLRDTLATN
ncbi:phenylacetyl-CoA ligase [Mycena crocata]|nr:phenylacetyl-CoA ligase [Mycena crocata]